MLFLYDLIMQDIFHRMWIFDRTQSAENVQKISQQKEMNDFLGL